MITGSSNRYLYSLGNTPEQQQQVRAKLDGADQPKRLRMAGLYRLGQKWTFSADYLQLLGGTRREQWDWSLSAGAETTLLSWLPLRAGFSSDFSQVALAVGLGVFVGPVHVDLAYSSLTLARGGGSIVSLSISVWPSEYFPIPT